MPSSIAAFGATSASSPCVPLTILRRDILGPDVRIDILWSGVCGTDLHQLRNDWQRSIFPIVPGHEIVGIVSETGSEVTKFREGDYVSVGCTVSTCMQCDDCQQGYDQFCLHGRVSTYNSPDPYLPNQATYGGYSEQILVNERFVIRIPPNLCTPEQLHRVAPLVCAGVTTWCPLQRFGVTKGKRVGVIGLGGLGHMAVKLAHALGAEVVVISRSHRKTAKALALGADRVVSSSNTEEMQSIVRSLDVVINTIPCAHDINAYMPIVRPFGAMVMLGYIGPLGAPSFQTGQVIFNNKTLTGSFIGGIPETQAVFDFCGQHNITADVEVIEMAAVNDALRRLDAGDVNFRFVIDVTKFRAEQTPEVQPIKQEK